MPLKPASQCSTPGCPGRGTHHGRCALHAEQLSRTIDQERGTATQRGYGAEWRKTRDQYLKEYPYCVQCWAMGREVQAQEVDHVVPKRLGGADDVSNFQSLCGTCHASKTMREINRMKGR